MAICKTVEEAFQAGFNAPCEHGIPAEDDCAKCRLTEDEIVRLALLLRPAPGVRNATQAAA